MQELQGDWSGQYKDVQPRFYYYLLSLVLQTFNILEK